jgi:hypothetical protein
MNIAKIAGSWRVRFWPFRAIFVRGTGVSRKLGAIAITAANGKPLRLEGEVLKCNQVRSSIARRLGLGIGALASADRDVERIVEMMLDGTQLNPEPLTA